VGDSIVVWKYADAQFTFRVHRGTDAVVGVRALAQFAPIRDRIRGTVPLTASTDSSTLPPFTGFLRSGDTATRSREFNPDSVLHAIYVRDTLRFIEAWRGFCGPGPYC
jgi:hypothetical protein